MFYASSLDNSGFKGRKSFFFQKKKFRGRKNVFHFFCAQKFFFESPPTILLILFVVNLINFFFSLDYVAANENIYKLKPQIPQIFGNESFFFSKSLFLSI